MNRNINKAILIFTCLIISTFIHAQHILNITESGIYVNGVNIENNIYKMHAAMSSTGTVNMESIRHGWGEDDSHGQNYHMMGRLKYNLIDSTLFFIALGEKTSGLGFKETKKLKKTLVYINGKLVTKELHEKLYEIKNANHPEVEYFEFLSLKRSKFTSNFNYYIGLYELEFSDFSDKFISINILSSPAEVFEGLLESDSYKEYLQFYPNSNKKQEYEYYACQDREEYRNYIETNKVGEYVSKAEIDLLNLEYLYASSSQNASDYYTFLNMYPNSIHSEEIEAKINYYYSEKLKSAIDQNDLKAIDTLAIKVNLNSLLDSSYYPLFRSKNIEVTNSLLNLGADISILNDGGQNCLFYAIDDLEYFKFLVTKGADLNITDSLNRANLLHFAIFKKKPEHINYLLNSSNINVNAKMKDGRSAVDLVSVSTNEIKDLFIKNSRIELSVKFEIANNEQKRELLKKSNLNLDINYVSRSFLIWLYEQGDYELAKTYLKKAGYILLVHFKEDTKFSSGGFQKKYNITIENKNITVLYSMASYSGVDRGWMILDSKIYILGSYKMYSTYTDFEFGKNSMVFTKTNN